MQHSIARIALLVALALPSTSAQQPAPALPQVPLELHGVSPEQCANLAALCKVWGFLKYHHRRVTGGELDWDGELFRILPRVLDAKDRAACNADLLAWCKEVGEPAPCDPCTNVTPYTRVQPPIAWIRDESRLGAELSAFLQRVHANRPDAPGQRYIDFEPGAGNPNFDAEDPQADAPVSDARFRLLALFRYWNVIEYWFPYREWMEEDWDAVLEEFVPRLVSAGDAETYALTVMELTARIHDTHGNLVSSLALRPPRGEAFLPVSVRFVEGRPTVIRAIGPAEDNELRRGDVILALDGRPVSKLLEEWRPYFAASNEAALQSMLGWVFTRGPAGPTQITIERDGATLEVAEARRPVDKAELAAACAHDLPGATFRLLCPAVAYVKLSSIRAEQIPELLAAAEGTRGLIIDIRNYPSDFVVFELGEHLVTAPTSFARIIQGFAANPGAFAWTREWQLRPKSPHYGGRIVVLVDEDSVSLSEYTAMAFSSVPGSIVIGSTTAGADGNVSKILLPCGLTSLISGIGVFWPDGRPTQRVGIVPDLEVHPTLGGVREGRDEVLEAALQALLGEGTAQDEVRRIAGEALKG
jgi:C-terminal processing protease CtpA/Prc